MIGVSAVSAASTVIVGVIGVLMIVVGGRAILAGQMTLGDFVMYIFFTGLVAAPVVSIASIGTQVSEAFAGLDRIREVRQMATEGQEDASREADRDAPRAKWSSTTSASRTSRASRCSRACRSTRRRARRRRWWGRAGRARAR